MNLNPDAFEELHHLLNYHLHTAETFRQKLTRWAAEPYTTPRRLRSIEDAKRRLMFHEAASRALQAAFAVPVHTLEIVAGGVCCACAAETPDGAPVCASCKGGVPPHAAVLPDNLVSHRDSWLAAMDRLVELETVASPRTCDSDEAGFWSHERNAMRVMYADLDRMNGDSNGQV